MVKHYKKKNIKIFITHLYVERVDMAMANMKNVNEKLFKHKMQLKF